MKNILFFCLVIISLSSCTKISQPLDDSLKNKPAIAGTVDLLDVLSKEGLSKFSIQEIDTLYLKKGNGEIYRSLKKVQGILLRDIIESVAIEGLTNKTYSSFYVICTAKDGYTTLYSWNELFNSPIGDQAYIITEADGKKLKNTDEGVMMVSRQDKINGRRNLRGLEGIKIMHYMND